MGTGPLGERATTTHLLEWPESRTLTTPGADDGVEQQELPVITGGNAQCGPATLEDSFMDWDRCPSLGVECW